MKLRLRELIFFTLLLALPIAAYALVFKPNAQEKARAQQEIQEKTQKLAELNNAAAGNANLPEQIDKLKKAITFFESRLPEERDMDVVLKEVWQIAEKNGLSTKSVRSMKPVAANGYSEQPIRMVVIGPFTGYYKFLQGVEKLPRITRINQLSLDKDMTREGQIKADFTLSVYFESNEHDSIAGMP